MSLDTETTVNDFPDSPRPGSSTGRMRRLPFAARIAIGFLAGAVAFVAVGATVDSVFGTPSSSSSPADASSPAQLQAADDARELALRAEDYVAQAADNPSSATAKATELRAEAADLKTLIGKTDSSTVDALLTAYASGLNQVADGIAANDPVLIDQGFTTLTSADEAFSAATEGQ